ncbi:MAG: HslU--HslV peptidase ATPase subunit, partial [Christensenellales bacterium]
KEMAHVAHLENENKENIGARRLHAIMEALLEEVSFEACGETAEETEVVVDKAYVDAHLADALNSMNLKKYIL